MGCGSGGDEEEVEDACEGGGCGGACLMGAIGAESQEEVGERIGTAVRELEGEVEKDEESEGRPAACEQDRGCAGWPGCLSLAGVYDEAD